MATHMDTRVEREEDGRLHVQNEIGPVEAKQGGTGKRILTVLISALVLAFLVWVPVEIWGNKQEAEPGPQQATPYNDAGKSGDANKPSTLSQPAQPLGTR